MGTQGCLRIRLDIATYQCYDDFMKKRIFFLTVLLGLASPAWGQSYDNSGFNAQADAMRQQQQQQEYQNQMTARQQQMQEQINQQQQEIDRYNNATGMERLTGNSYNGPLGR